MNQPNDAESGTVAVSNANHRGDGRRVVRKSTRILLDSNSQPTCNDCGASITHGTQYKSVTVQDRSGTFTDLAFCDERCRSNGL